MIETTETITTTEINDFKTQVLKKYAVYLEHF